MQAGSRQQRVGLAEAQRSPLGVARATPAAWIDPDGDEVGEADRCAGPTKLHRHRARHRDDEWALGKALGVQRYEVGGGARRASASQHDPAGCPGQPDFGRCSVCRLLPPGDQRVCRAAGGLGQDADVDAFAANLSRRGVVRGDERSERGDVIRRNGCDQGRATRTRTALRDQHRSDSRCARVWSCQREPGGQDQGEAGGDSDCAGVGRSQDPHAGQLGPVMVSVSVSIVLNLGLRALIPCADQPAGVQAAPGAGEIAFFRPRASAGEPRREIRRSRRSRFGRSDEQRSERIEHA